jgi:hypothetical protein
MSATDLTEAQIAVHWKEEGYVYPSPSFIAQANLTDASIDQRFSLEVAGHRLGTKETRVGVSGRHRCG